MSDKMQMVPLPQIRESKVALRAVDKESEQYHELVESVRSKGVLLPIRVRMLVDAQTNQPYFSLIDGLHRFCAACDAGLYEIPAIVTEADDAEIMEQQIVANIQRIESRPVEYSQQLKRILAMNPLLTVNELAVKLGKSEAWLGERLGLLKLIKEAASLVDEAKIPLSNAYILAKLPPEEQPNFIERAMTQNMAEFSGAVSSRIKELRDAVRQGRLAKPEEFVPSPHYQKIKDVQNEIANRQIGPAILSRNNVSDVVEAFYLALQWALHLDPDSVSAAKAKEEARRKEADEAKKKRDQERAKKKAEDAAKAAEEAKAAAVKAGVVVA